MKRQCATTADLQRALPLGPKVKGTKLCCAFCFCHVCRPKLLVMCTCHASRRRPHTFFIFFMDLNADNWRRVMKNWWASPMP
eukprot:4504491-Amphidinium_carterae.1